MINIITGDGSGHFQSLILCAAPLNLSFFLAVIGILADLIECNRKMLEDLLLQSRKNDRKISAKDVLKKNDLAWQWTGNKSREIGKIKLCFNNKGKDF